MPHLPMWSGMMEAGWPSHTPILSLGPLKSSPLPRSHSVFQAFVADTGQSQYKQHS